MVETLEFEIVVPCNPQYDPNCKHFIEQLTVINPSPLPGIILMAMGLVNAGYHLFMFYYGNFNTSPNALNFDTWLSAGYNTLILSSWVFKGIQFVSWPLSFIS